MALRLPRGAEREYLALYGITAIYVAAIPTGPTLVGSSRDLLRSLIGHRRRFVGAQITCAYWLAEESEAELIVREVRASFAQGSEGLLVASAKTAQRRIENTAAHMGIVLTDHDTVTIRARAAVAFIEDKIDQAHADGSLRWFNSAFRAWRIEAKAYGRSMSYAEARARLRRLVFREVLSGQFHGVSNVQRPEIFPPLEH